MKRLLFSSALAIGIAAVAVSVSWSDSSSPSNTATGSDAPPEPITGSAVMPNPGSETIRHDPFTPYDIGGSAAAWSYNDLTAPEQAQVDAAADVTGWDNVHNGFATATNARILAAKAATAANRLNAGDLASQGVVP